MPALPLNMPAPPLCTKPMPIGALVVTPPMVTGARPRVAATVPLTKSSASCWPVSVTVDPTDDASISSPDDPVSRMTVAGGPPPTSIWTVTWASPFPPTTVLVGTTTVEPADGVPVFSRSGEPVGANAAPEEVAAVELAVGLGVGLAVGLAVEPPPDAPQAASSRLSPANAGHARQARIPSPPTPHQTLRYVTGQCGA
jgi:hypothetical protein